MHHTTDIIGRLGRDPESRYTPEGKLIVSFSVAVDDGFGEKKSTLWFRVTAWDKTGENCAKYLKKGSLVFVSGRLGFDKATGGPKVWTKQDGTASASFELTASTVRFLSRTEAAQAEQAAPVDESEFPF